MSGGSALYDGLDYQALVSVLAAIELVVIAGKASQIELEPPSEEDAEADVHCPLGDDEACRVETASAVDEGYRLIVQSKRRDAGTWSAAAFDRLLKHGGDKRGNAATRLRGDLQVRYLLATSGQMVRGAERLRTEAFLDWPTAETAGTRYAAYAHAGQSRVAIMGGLTEAQIKARLFETLRVSLSIPHHRIAECVEELRLEAWRRGASQHTGVWTRDEIEATLTAHEAVLPGAWREDGFVEPVNYEALRSKLLAQQAILIAGPSGTGKTRVALRLRAEIHQANPGMTRADLRIADGPSEIAREIENAPVLIYIEDPWGPVAFAPGAAAWTKALTEALGRTRPGVWFIITSRSDILADPRTAERELAPWRVELEASSYEEPERRKLFELNLPRLSPSLQRLAATERDNVVATLTLPLEIDRYFAQFRFGPRPDDSDIGFLRRVLAEASLDTYAEVVATQMRERGDQVWAVALWLLFKGDKALEPALLGKVRRGMTKLSPGAASGLDPLIRFMVAGHSFEWSNDRLTCAHPKVDAGLAKVADDDAGLVDDILANLLEILTRAEISGAGPSEIALAARILAEHAPDSATAAAASLDALNAPVRAAIDGHLANVLLTLRGADFRAALFASARIGSHDNAMFDLAAWLTSHPEPDGTFEGMMPGWEAPERPPEWFANIGAQPWARPILESFVETVVGYESHFYPDDLATHLVPFGVDLAPSFTRMAERSAGYGYDSTIAIAIAGGIVDLDGFVPAVMASIAVLESDTPARRDGWQLSLANGEYDEEYADHLAGGHDDDNYAAGEITSAFAQALRKQRGWRALATFERVDRLIYPWIHAIETDPSQASREEILTLLDRAVAAGGWPERHFWWLVAPRVDLAMSEQALKRLNQNPEPLVRVPLHHVLASHAPEALLAAQAADLGAERHEDILLRIRDLTLGQYGAQDPGSSAVAAKEALLAALPAGMAAVARETTKPLDRELRTDDSDAVAAARQVFSRDGSLAAHLLRLGGTAHPQLEALYEIAFDAWTPDAPEAPLIALQTAIDDGDLARVRDALTHPLAMVRKLALKALGPQLSDGEAAALAINKSYYLRRALVDVLADRGTPADTLLLVALCRDTYFAAYSGRKDPYPVASAAARGLTAMTSHTAETLNEIRAVALKVKDANTRRQLLALLARHDTEARSQMLLKVLGSPSAALRRVFATALLDTIDQITPQELAALDSTALINAPPQTAIILAQIVGWLGDDKQVLPIAERLARSARSHALVLLLTGPSPSRHRRQALADHLPPNHPARALLAAPAGGLLDHDAIDDLGDPTLTGLVRSELGDRFALPPARPGTRWS